MHRRRTIIGIAGDSGAGKSTYVRGLARLLGTERVTIIGLDDYHTLDRAQRKATGITPLNPRCNDLGLLIDHAWQLRRGETILKPVYDHATGTFADPEEVRPADYVVLEGLHALYLEMLRAALDLKVYFDTALELKLRWKMERDVKDRGHTEEQVRREIEQRQPDILAYIEPQKRFADLIVSLLPKPGSRDVKVALAERPGPQTIHARLSQDGWRRRLGAVEGQQALAGVAFDVLEFPEPVGADTVQALLAHLGAGELAVPAGSLGPVELSQVLVAWRILQARQAAGAEAVSAYAAQG